MYLKTPLNKDDHYIGDLQAPISIVQYGDYECWISAKSSHWMDEILSEFRGKVVFAYRHFPLTYVHPNAALAAVAAEAAAKENKFWEMHHLLFDNFRKLSGKTIFDLATEIGIAPEKFSHDVESNNLMDIVIKDIMDGEDSGVESCPAFFMNGTKLSGIVNYDTIKTDILHRLHEPVVHS
jgi:protein-disulfide isomerase